MLQATTTSYATSSAQRYFAQINNNGQPNATALQLIAAAPQTIAPATKTDVVLYLRVHRRRAMKQRRS